MQLYTEAQEYAAPELYWEVLDLLLAMPVEAFTAHSVAWEALDTAIQKGITVNFSRGPAFRPHRDIRGIARLCTASLGTGPPAHRRRNDRSGS